MPLPLHNLSGAFNDLKAHFGILSTILQILLGLHHSRLQKQAKIHPGINPNVGFSAASLGGGKKCPGMFIRFLWSL